jgi:penicillin-binding protein 2
MSSLDWHELMAESAARADVPGTRRRLQMLLAAVALASGLVLVRAVQLELSGGRDFRAVATRPITHTRSLPADRGRILARDGSVLAADSHTHALALHYRWLQQPPDPDWLRRQAMQPLNRRQRRDAALVRAREVELLSQRAELHRRLAQLCGLADDNWRARCERVERHVGELAQRVNERRQARHELAVQEAAAQALADSAAPLEWWQSLASALGELFAPEAPAPPARLVLAEEQDYHPLVEDLSAEAADEISAHPDDYPGVRIVELGRRQYPSGSLAAHVVGHLGATDVAPSQGLPTARAMIGRMGIERQFDALLSGTPGVEVEQLDHRDKSLGVQDRRSPIVGRDVQLTIDASLQRWAEGLLDGVCRARSAGAEPAASGGAVMVMDVSNGELLVAACAPRFDPGWFASGDATALARLFASLHDPLVDRVAKMAIPPGSVFKTLTAIALVESHACDPEEEFHCQGYLHEPDRQRCMIYRQQGIGHGAVTLATALAESCNVYFLHHASELGPEPLIACAKRFGFGRVSGVDLPDEAAGSLPRSSPGDPRSQRLAIAQALAIGQGTLTVTPLQVARMMAAVANGGRLLRPKIVLGDLSADGPGFASPKPDGSSSDASGEAIHVSQQTLRAVREGLRRTVADPQGTAYSTARLNSVAIAGKTGTAQTAGADHAWFAGYAPADEPRVVVVVVLEHGGHAVGAARIARDLVVRLHRQGYLGTEEHELAGD